MTVNSSLIFGEVQKKLQQISCNEFLAKSTVSITSTLESLQWGKNDVDQHYDSKVLILNKKKDNLIRLSLLSYEVPKELGFYLRLSIEEICGQRIEFSDVRFILQSEVNKNLWLQNLTERLSGNQIFGNFFNKEVWNETLRSIKVKRIRNHKRSTDSLPEKRTIGVGYRDKGTLPKSTSPGSLKQLSLTSLQNEIEENRAASDDLDKILEGFFW